MDGDRQSAYFVREIKPTDLDLNFDSDEKLLGSGNFGSVFRGRLKTDHESKKYELVAVKKLKLQDAMKEINLQLLQQLQKIHSQILRQSQESCPQIWKQLHEAYSQMLQKLKRTDPLIRQELQESHPQMWQQLQQTQPQIWQQLQEAFSQMLLKMQETHPKIREELQKVYSQTLQRLQEAISKEIQIMSKIGHHENILKLIGSMKEEDLPCLISEFCDLGSLDKFLGTRKNSFIDEIVQFSWKERTTVYKALMDENWAALYEQRRLAKILTTSDLICFAYQIANGMEFMHSKEVMHRDLALRNILLTSNYIVKIGDFGLSRRTIKGLHQTCQNSAVPLKWTAPEALSGMIVSMKSDLYTFGVLLWELFTLGGVPFEQLKTIEEFRKFVNDGNKFMNRPRFAPSEMYQFMISLWNREPKFRPALKECKEHIMEQLQRACPPLASRFEVADGLKEPDKKKPKEAPLITSPAISKPNSTEKIRIQSSLRSIYSKSYRSVIQFSAPFFFDVEEKWVNLTLKLEIDSSVTEDYATLLKKAFVKADMLIIEGDPGIGKSSLMHRLAYEWSQSRLSDYDLVLYIEFRKLCENECKDIKELITHYMKGYLDEEDYEIFHHFISDTKCCKQHKILVLLDGYDESALEKQCQELSDYFSSTISRPLSFNVLLTSRKGYLTKLRNQGRFIFADIIGFTTESQRQEYLSKYFKAKSDTESSGSPAAVAHLLNTNTNLQRLSESPLMLTFICLLHKKIVDGTEVELYMNIIWWMIDRYQKSNPNQDVPSLFDFQHDQSDKFGVIENKFQNFPQLHLLGKMAMQDIFKTTFTETDLNEIQLNDVVQQVGLLRKEEIRDASFHTKIEFSFVHRSVQEFIMALTFFLSNEEPTDRFCWYIFRSGRYMGYGIIQAEVQTFLNMISLHKIDINMARKNKYSQLLSKTKPSALFKSLKLPQDYTIIIHLPDEIEYLNLKYNNKLPQSQEEAIKSIQNEAKQRDAVAQYILGTIYGNGILTTQSDEEAVKWYTKAAEQGQADAQCNLGFMYEMGKGVPHSEEEAIKWYTESAKQGDAFAQNNLGNMCKAGKGVPQSDEEAVKWYTKSAEQGVVFAQNNLGNMYRNGHGIPQSDEEAVKWYTKSAEQGNAFAQNNLGNMYKAGNGVPRSDDVASEWYRKSAEQGNEKAQCNLGNMYKTGNGVPQSYEEAVKWFTKSAEQGEAFAQSNLAAMYRLGKGVSQSDEEAVKWYTKSAEQGDATAQFSLGLMYENGQGVPQSDEVASEWYRKSAEQGYADAQLKLGGMYETGRGVPQSDEVASEWYKRSAEQGNDDAQLHLLLLYVDVDDDDEPLLECALPWR